jgi:hypothetical protein
MGNSAVLLAKRALVALIRSLALTYGVVVCCNRDSADQVVLGSFRKVALKAHPDHGGNTSDQAKMNEAREAWDQARRQKATAGRPKGPGQAKGKQGQSDKCLLLVVDVPTGKGRKEYRVQSQAAMLTYMGFDGGMDQWGRFCDFVHELDHQFHRKALMSDRVGSSGVLTSVEPIGGHDATVQQAVVQHHQDQGAQPQRRTSFQEHGASNLQGLQPQGWTSQVSVRPLRPKGLEGH